MPKTPTSWTCAAGHTFLNRNPTSPERLWIVADGPSATGDVVIFPLRRLRHNGWDDLTCVLQSHDHPSIGHQPMAVSYEEGRQLSVVVRDAMLEGGFVVQCQPLTDHVLERVRRGAIDSEFTPQKFQHAIAMSTPKAKSTPPKASN